MATSKNEELANVPVQSMSAKFVQQLWDATPQATKEILATQLLTKAFEHLSTSPAVQEFADVKVREVLREVVVPQEVMETIHREALASLRGRLNAVVAQVVQEVSLDASQQIMGRFKGIIRY